jgi:hypothetical protein
VHQRTRRGTISTGLMPDLLLRLENEVAPIARTAPGFIGYFAVATDDLTFVSTRVFRDRESLEAETQATLAVTNSIVDEFGIQTPLETIVDGPIAVLRAYGPLEEFTP